MEKRQLPLPQSFLFIGLMGFLIVAIYGYFGSLDIRYATAFGTVFLLMIIASFVTMSPKRL